MCWALLTIDQEADYLFTHFWLIDWESGLLIDVLINSLAYDLID